MLFRFLLFNFHIVLKTVIVIASLRSRAFRNRLKEKDVLIQVKMTNDNKGRYYKLKKGKLTSAGKIIHEEPDIALIWSDSSTAMRTLMKFKPRNLVEAVTNAIATGKLAVECNVASTYWFGMVMKDMLTVYRII